MSDSWRLILLLYDFLFSFSLHNIYAANCKLHCWSTKKMTYLLLFGSMFLHDYSTGPHQIWCESGPVVIDYALINESRPKQTC